MKENLWSEQAKQMDRTPNELNTWYENMRTKLGKLKKTKSGQAAASFTPTERQISLYCYTRVFLNTCSNIGEKC